jgi:hypothetical protein
MRRHAAEPQTLEHKVHYFLPTHAANTMNITMISPIIALRARRICKNHGHPVQAIDLNIQNKRKATYETSINMPSLLLPG